MTKAWRAGSRPRGCRPKALSGHSHTDCWLRLASFAQPQRLQKDGTSTYMAPQGMAPQPTPLNVRVNQGTIEKSNVNSIMEMTRLIEVTRTYTQVAGMLQQQSDMRRSAIEKLAEVPA